jgi:N-acylneuraminate cytidylyltransferase
MLFGKPITAIVPARGGSKGVPRKNLRRLGRNTLLERAIKLGQRSPWVERVIVSTDDEEMHAQARSYGVAAPSLRPPALAADNVPTAPVVQHLIEQAEIADGYLLLLQPTSPFRTLADLDGLCRAFETAEGADAIVSLCRHEDPHPAKLQTIRDGWVRFYLDAHYSGPRQALPAVYALNGSFYLTSRETFLNEKRFLTDRTAPYVMPPERSLNIDTMMDWVIAKALVDSQAVPFEEYD